MGTQKTHLEQGSPFLSKHYLNWKLKGIERIDNLQKKELMFSAPFSISRSDFLKLKDQMLEFIKILYETASKSDPEELTCINLIYLQKLFYFNSDKLHYVSIMGVFFLFQLYSLVVRTRRIFVK